LQGQAFTIPIWGRHYLTSALAAIAVGQNMNLSLAEMASALEQFEPLPQRCEITSIDGTTIINDTYNACPTAMRAALDLVRDFDTRGRRIVVCGDMRELGREAVEQHRNLGDEVVTICGADLLVACGEYSRDVVTGARDAGMPVGQAIACNSPREALPFLLQQLVPGDVVLLKGSRVMAMETILEGLQGQLRKRAA
jgi:UDP-N-acetylmuramyl pentapeptide synthase